MKGYKTPRGAALRPARDQGLFVKGMKLRQIGKGIHEEPGRRWPYRRYESVEPVSGKFRYHVGVEQSDKDGLWRPTSWSSFGLANTKYKFYTLSSFQTGPSEWTIRASSPSDELEVTGQKSCTEGVRAIQKLIDAGDKRIYLVRGPFCFGFGDSLDEAKRNAKKYAPRKGGPYWPDKKKPMMAEAFKIHPDTEIGDFDGRMKWPEGGEPEKLGEVRL